MRAGPILLLVLVPPIASSCAGDSNTHAGPTPWFEERSSAAGVDFVWRSGCGEERLYFPEIMGGGAALLDMDGDLDLDLYLVQGGSVLASEEERARGPGNVLYRNEGDGTFVDVSEESGADDRGFGMGVATGDFDGDGLEDLYVTNVGRNTLLKNLGGGEFEDVTEAAGVGDTSWSASAGFFDYDRDGDLDLFVVDYIFWSPASELSCQSKLQESDYCSPKSYNAPAPDLLYRNEGDGRFTEVSSELGLRTAFGNGLGLVFSDFDGDGFTDVFVANDGVKNQLWMNEGGERFREAAVPMGCAVDQDGREKAGMGTHAVDLDDDGDEDLLVVNLSGEPDTYFRNDGSFFSDKTPLVGLTAASRPFTRFGTGFCDFDHDGLVDLYQANGRVTRSPDVPGPRTFDQENLVFRGGADGRFREVEPRGGVVTPLSATSRAAAFGDLDGDGAVDLVVVNRDAPAHVLFNRAGSAGGWIAFRVRETSGRAALGAVVRFRVGDRRILRVVRSAYGYCSASSPLVHFGLGRASGVTDVEVTFADGTVRSYGDLAAGSVHELSR